MAGPLLEFHLARLTAKSAAGPRSGVGGGLAEYPLDDVQAALSSAPPMEYIAVMARVGQSDIATGKALGVSMSNSRTWWFENPRNYRTRITAERLDRIAQAATLVFLSPFDNENKPPENASQVKRDDEWCARWCKSTPEAWAKFYRHHFGTVLAGLVDPYLSGYRRVRYLLGEKTSNAPQTLDAA